MDATVAVAVTSDVVVDVDVGVVVGVVGCGMNVIVIGNVSGVLVIDVVAGTVVVVVVVAHVRKEHVSHRSPETFEQSCAARAVNKHGNGCKHSPSNLFQSRLTFE